MIARAIERRRQWGVVPCILLLTVLMALWVDAYAVSAIFGIAGCSGCNGLWGEAQRDINIAGWLYGASGLLCCIAVARLRRVHHRDSRQRVNDYWATTRPDHRPR